MKLVGVKVKKVKKNDAAGQELQQALAKMRPVMDSISKAINVYMKEDKEEAVKKLALFNKMINLYFEMGGK